MRLIALTCLAGFAAGPVLAQTPSPPATAKPHRHHLHRHRAPSRTVTATALPPPPAPAQPGSPAPVPDESVAPPPGGATPRTEVTPSLMSIHYPPVGEGYVQGSSPQAMDDRNTAKAPGLEVTVPITQSAPSPLPPVTAPHP